MKECLVQVKIGLNRTVKTVKRLDVTGWPHLMLECCICRCASSPCSTWDLSSSSVSGGHYLSALPSAASLPDQTPSLLPHRLTPLRALNQSPAALPQTGPLTRVLRPPPPTAAWAAATIVCGSNTPSSCWRIITMGATGHSPLSRRTSSTRTSKPIWRWRSGS